jgi:transposase
MRRLLINGAAALVRQTSRRAPPAGSWLARMLARKPRMLVISVLANKMARTFWALLAHNEVYRAPAVAAG